MRKIYTYIISFAIIASSVSIFSCKKSPHQPTEVWLLNPDFDGSARSEAVSFVIGDFAYISTGFSTTGQLRDLWEYDPAKQYWVQKADLPGIARNSAVGFSIGTKGYIGTGRDNANMLNDFWEYDQATNAWTQKDNFPGTPRYDAVAFTLNNKGYISCGYDGNDKNDLWQFNPFALSGSQWTQKTSLGGSGRSAAQVFVLKDKAYICSGNKNGTPLNDLWMYDDITDTWYLKRFITDVSTDTYDDNYTSIARFNGAAFTENNFAYLTTGSNSSLVSDTWKYDPDSDLWTKIKSFEGSPRIGAIAFSLNNRGFVATGRDGALSFDDCYEWIP